MCLLLSLLQHGDDWSSVLTGSMVLSSQTSKDYDLDLVRFNECVYYLRTYGNHTTLISFYVRHSCWYEAAKYIMDNVRPHPTSGGQLVSSPAVWWEAAIYCIIMFVNSPIGVNVQSCTSLYVGVWTDSGIAHEYLTATAHYTAGLDNCCASYYCTTPHVCCVQQITSEIQL